jgi:cysteine desulfuration protein SufE
MSLAEKQRQLIEDLNLIPDVQERLSALTTYAARMRLDPRQQVDANLVPGCVSRVWLHGELREGFTRFDCEADSPMVKALAAVLCDLYSEATPAEVVAVEPDIWQQCQFTKMLSPTRLNGLANVRRMIREKAAEWA